MDDSDDEPIQDDDDSEPELDTKEEAEAEGVTNVQN